MLKILMVNSKRKTKEENWRKEEINNMQICGWKGELISWRDRKNKKKQAKERDDRLKHKIVWQTQE